ncbi:hypothetical protein QJ857_gp1148 [Tupanvirus soda lake]|uniref:Uncharacterized protein n=2 Tax=Tupanvirus TaxID=2094720 RepID=A0A6N1NTE6_9VIRU|nr:hypothetical protein QJ857_gp1148 [Tupanvirus soda lake]QKU34906.1 hypothetical protein [Tupanvirus soda lake]
MDYKEKYLKLKRHILEENQRGSGRLNPLFIEQLSNLSFVVGDNVLGDDVHAVILSLVEEFNRIAATDLKHNLELSQYYAVGKGLTNKEGVLVCENCEIVLKYVDTTVCISNGRVRQHISEVDGKHYHTNKLGERTEVDCTISRGLVRFYLKQKDGNTYRYTRIRVVNVQNVESLQSFIDAVYQNNDEISKLEEAGNVAISKGQTDAILSTSQSGQLEANTPEEIMCATRTVNNIITEAKNAVVQSQLSKMNNQRVVSTVPTQSAVNAANTVANTIMKTNAANSKNMTAIMVPNNEPTPLQADTNVESVPAVINSKGISARAPKSGTNTMNSRVINNRSSLAVDANVAVIPTRNVAVDKNINVTQPSAKSDTSVTNKLVGVAKNVVNKTEDVVEAVADKTGQVVSDVTNKFKDFFNKTFDQTNTTTTTPASVVPVSQNLSVMTSLPQDKASSAVPVPQNDNESVLFPQSIQKSTTLSQRTALRRFENKLARNNGSNISVAQTNQASQTVKNGNTTVRRTQETIRTTQTNPSLNQMLDRSQFIGNNTSDVSLTSNRTIAGPQRNTAMTNATAASNRYNKLTQNLDLSDMTDNNQTIQNTTQTTQTTTATSRFNDERLRRMGIY